MKSTERKARREGHIQYDDLVVLKMEGGVMKADIVGHESGPPISGERRGRGDELGIGIGNRGSRGRGERGERGEVGEEGVDLNRELARYIHCRATHEPSVPSSNVGGWHSRRDFFTHPPCPTNSAANDGGTETAWTGHSDTCGAGAGGAADCEEDRDARLVRRLLRHVWVSTRRYLLQEARAVVADAAAAVVDARGREEEGGDWDDGDEGGVGEEDQEKDEEDERGGGDTEGRSTDDAVRDILTSALLQEQEHHEHELDNRGNLDSRRRGGQQQSQHNPRNPARQRGFRDVILRMLGARRWATRKDGERRDGGEGGGIANDGTDDAFILDGSRRYMVNDWVNTSLRALDTWVVDSLGVSIEGWATVLTTGGDSHVAHQHGSATLAGVYYVDSGGRSGGRRSGGGMSGGGSGDSSGGGSGDSSGRSDDTDDIRENTGDAGGGGGGGGGPMRLYMQQGGRRRRHRSTDTAIFPEETEEGREGSDRTRDDDRPPPPPPLAPAATLIEHEGRLVRMHAVPYSGEAGRMFLWPGHRLHAVKEAGNGRGERDDGDDVGEMGDTGETGGTGEHGPGVSSSGQSLKREKGALERKEETGRGRIAVSFNVWVTGGWPAGSERGL